MDIKKEVLKKFLGQGIQISPAVLDSILASKNPLGKTTQLIEKHQTDANAISPVDTQAEETKTEKRTQVQVIKSHDKPAAIKNVQDISNHFNTRFNQFKKILQPRMGNPLSINHLKRMEKEKASIISMVTSKKATAKGNILLDLEDPTGTFRAIATSKEAISKATEVVEDEVIGVSGSVGRDILFIDDITWPDIPMRSEKKTITDDICAAFVSDTHIGSKKFLRADFLRMLDWLESGDGLAEKIRYIFVAGDIVDGIGVYPKQEKELSCTDIYEQYQEAAEYFSRVPDHIQLLLCPGNHDYIRLAQPQPPLDPDAAAPLYALGNTTLVSNPTLVNIHGFDNGGLNILMYHGVSIDSMVAATPTLKDGYTHPEKVMHSLLKRRHLSPQYTSGIVADETDFLVIDTIPDIFHTGHVHSNGVQEYRGVTLINSGTWQAQTDFQKLCGHTPTSSQLPVVNLKTRNMSLVDFTQK